MKIKYGIIEEGKLKGKRVIVSPRNGLLDNEYLVENGFLNGSLIFSKACLKKGCEKMIGTTCPCINNKN